jgi:cytochrome c-type biogenesis protein CcmH/NrfF
MRLFRHVPQIAVLLLMALLLLGAGDDSARFKDLGHRMMCMCGCNEVLLECNHVGCTRSDRMRAELVSALDRGDNDSLVLQDFVQNYGPTVLLAPTTTGFNRVAWIMPFAALFLGLGSVYYVIMSWKRRPAPPFADGLRPLRGPMVDQFRNQARRETEL